MRALLPAEDSTELSRISREGVTIDLGTGGGFIRVSVVGVEVGVSRCWLFGGCCDCGRELLEGVVGGRIGAGCRLFVGAIGTSLKVWNADGISSALSHLRGYLGIESCDLEASELEIL